MPQDSSGYFSNTSSDPGYTQATIATPDLSPSLKPRNRSIRDVAQAKNIISSLGQAAREVNSKNARIQSKINAETPYSQCSLDNDGLGWRSNFSTQPLPQLVNKVAPRFVQTVEGMRYLTNSALPDDEPGAAAKTEIFRKEITSTVRARDGWREFISSLAMENALFGYAVAARLDEFSWFPKFFRQDEVFFPTGTKQNAKSAQVLVLKENFLIHELFSLIEDKKAAEIRGWDIKNTVEVLNNAMPEDKKSRYADTERIYQDLIRESSLGMSFEAGALVVSAWHLYATEVDGQVSHYIYDCEDFQQLFCFEDQFKNMAEVAAFFSFEQGNGTMRGSKGIGRQLYAMAGVLDRARNEVVDRLNLSGKIIVQADDKALRRFKMSIVGNVVLIGQGYTISERKLDAAVTPFLELDQFLSLILDQIAGATTPKVFEGDRVTKAQVDFFAYREEESKDNVMSRFLIQFAKLMTLIQTGLCDPHTGEKDAKEMQKRLLEVMTKDELKRLAAQPIAETIRDFTDLERQQMVLVAQQAQGNPLYNQKEVERRKLIATVGEEVADAILLPDEDPTETAEQTRLQQFELLIIAGQGAAVPISPRDNDVVHLAVLMPAMEAAAVQATQDPNADEVLQVLLAHAEGHYNSAMSKGVDKESLVQVEDVLKKLRPALAEMQRLSAEAEALAAQAAPVVTEGVPQGPV